MEVIIKESTKQTTFIMLNLGDMFVYEGHLYIKVMHEITEACYNAMPLRGVQGASLRDFNEDDRVTIVKSVTVEI